MTIKFEQYHRKCLTEMGYRKITEDIWCKPVGYNEFTFNAPVMEWLNLFKSSGENEKEYIWNSEIYDDSEPDEISFLRFLKDVESRTTISRVSNDSSYHFLTIMDRSALGLL